MQSAVALQVADLLDIEVRDLRVQLAAAFPTTRLTQEQLAAWEDELTALQAALRGLDAKTLDWAVLLEYRPPLSTSRIDVLLLTGVAALVLEFKMIGRGAFSSQNRRQAVGYAVDLYWGHPLTEGRAVDAAVVATLAMTGPDDGVGPRVIPDKLPESALRLSRHGLRSYLESLALADAQTAPTPEQWLDVAYSPRPTIVDAAVGLVASASDPTITVPLADDEELLRLTAALADVVHSAATSLRHVVVFVAGVPGAGKTLVGLRIAHDEHIVARLRKEGAVPLYLSGNYPLVQVLTEALARDRSVEPAVSLRDARVAARALIRMVHDFVTQHAAADSPLPATNLVVFDEAQRAWDAEQMARGPSNTVGVGVSEPEALLRAMSRKPWAVVVALVGTGQEIHRGEAGVEAWAEALNRTQHEETTWSAIAPGAIADSIHEVDTDEAFVLSTSRRAQDLPDMAEWVEAVLALDCASAEGILAESSFDVFVTRELDPARRWLGSRERRLRPGLVASARAGRLRPYGLELSNDFLRAIQWDRWFLDLPPSLHSSYLLEVAATEFKCQGLELDLVGMCWGWDFSPAKGLDVWEVKDLQPAAARWRKTSPLRRKLTVNAYRVLLTRARVGMVVWVPRGDRGDPSRPRKPMDRVYEVLVKSGARPLKMA